MLEPRSSHSDFKWPRTAFARIDGAVDIAEDDWSLSIDGMSVARIYRVRGGPHDGRWFWEIGPGRVPFNSGAGNADGGRQAREACEAILRERWESLKRRNRCAVKASATTSTK
jgi:hypothetical protein